MWKKYYLEDEYSLNSCDCIEKHDSVDEKIQTMPQPVKEQAVSPVNVAPVYVAPPIECKKAEIGPTPYPPFMMTHSKSDNAMPCRIVTACMPSNQSSINHVKLCREINTNNKEILNGQFPCPCMFVETDGTKDDLLDLQLSRWWGWHWLKKRENILRAKLEAEGKRFSDEYPILMANHFVNYNGQRQDKPTQYEADTYTQPQVFQSELSQRPSPFSDKQVVSPYETQQPVRTQYPSQHSKSPYPSQHSKSPYPSQHSKSPYPSQHSKSPYASQHSKSPYQSQYQSQHSQAPYQSQHSQVRQVSTKEFKPLDLGPVPKETSYFSQRSQQPRLVERNNSDELIQINKDLSARPPTKKKRSFVQSCLDTLRTFTKKPDVCQCTKDIQVCGPTIKPCGGQKGYIMPCGLECVCEEDKSCLIPHLAEICPCKDTCRCPKEGLPPPPPPIVTTTNADICSTSNEACNCAPSTFVPFKDAACNCGSSSAEQYGCCATATNREEVQMTYTIEVTDNESCCCSCDDENLCDCRCCDKKLDITNNTVQTSRFCLADKLTQTDKVVRKNRCCRCCKCCNNKGQQRCASCKNKPNGLNNPPCDKQPPSCRPKSVHGLDKTAHTTRYQQNYENYKYRSYYTGSSNRSVQLKQPSCDTKRTKTLMVRTNSVQCLPAQENKATCCSCDEKFSPRYHHRVNRFIAELHGTNYDQIKAELLGEPQKETIKLEASDINAMTSARLRNFFLEGDTYSSPVTGRNYDLSYKSVDLNPKITTNKSNLKPLDVNEEIQYSKLSTQCFSSELEHTKLMTSICEAILSNKDDKKCLKSTSPVEILNTIHEDNESLTVLNQDNVEMEHFKDKIDNLEQKITKLMNDNVKSRQTRNKSRNASPKNKISPKSETSSLRQKSGDFKNENDALEKYENLLTDNQKCVDELLGQLEALHGCNVLLNNTVARHLHQTKSSCCFDKIDDDCRPNLLGTGEHLLSNKNLFTQFDVASSRNAQGETVLMDKNGERLDFFGPSTSFAGKSNTNCNSNVVDTKNEKLNLDFSNIVFAPQVRPLQKNNSEDPCDVLRSPWMQSQNYIVQNLPVIQTNISDTYAIEKILRDNNNKVVEQINETPIFENFSLSETNTSSNSLPISPSSSVCTVDVKNKL